MFKVGDLITRPAGHKYAGVVRTVSEVFPYGAFNYANSLIDDYSVGGGCLPEFWERVPASAPTARVLDPSTSKGKRKASRYAEAVVFLLGMNPNGLTGKQMAELSGFQLNCITPRFAPLRRKGLISDSGNRRDKQIVWVKAC